MAAFLAGQLGFLGIEATVESVLAQHEREELESIEQLEEIDARARRLATEVISRGN